ncbi:hypothetical protein SYYSPA8_24180 [Streptomyces yaizuensis]|uniref:Uncharacterized protein n=1 Tax=Streptomyces yaizuensis TaxID=2989713 RepID=A0ABQ5P4D8_9ACTN|nr:hypothetical protein SYYSPA8_24180 [Streptomyces sp. YSPA8]
MERITQPNSGIDVSSRNSGDDDGSWDPSVLSAPAGA